MHARSEDVEFAGKLLSGTRRDFIRDIAAAGASTAAAMYGLEETGVTDFVGSAAAAGEDPLSTFTAIAAGSRDTIEVPPGFRYQVIIRYGDQFANDDGTVYRYGYNNDFLAYFPLDGSDEGLLFVNHEYPDPFLLHGYKVKNTADPNPRKRTKSRNDVYKELEAVGNSIVHVRRDEDGLWQVVTPSPYNRRIFGGTLPNLPSTALSFTGPLAPGGSAPDAKVGGSALGSHSNCSGGITPWGTALSCEENYDGAGTSFFDSTADFAYGWDFVGAAVPDNVQQDGQTKNAVIEHIPRTGAPDESRRYGWVCEHDPYSNQPGRKHTALGRFRHENTAFRVAAGKKFVLYMGDDQANQGVYKFVSTRSFDPSGTPAARANNLAILTEGTLYVARFAPEGRRRFNTLGDTTPVSPTSGSGVWKAVAVGDLFDTRLRLAGIPTTGTGSTLNRRSRMQTGVNDDPANEGTYAGAYNRSVDPTKPESDPAYVYLGADPVPSNYVNEWDQFYATNRPEDVEVDTDGSIWVALTNNTGAPVRDAYGSIRRMVEAGGDPEATSFTWADISGGGPRASQPEGQRGYASPDNLVFDSAGNCWIVTDISSSALNVPGNANQFHGNNAVFMIPKGTDIAYRFANMPGESEGTGPYFTPDEHTLFVNVQHPGELTGLSNGSVFGTPSTYTSYWPRAEKGAPGAVPHTPLPSMVAITRVPAAVTPTPTATTTPTPTPSPGPSPTPIYNVPDPEDRTAPQLRVSQRVATTPKRFAKSGVPVRIEIDEAATVVVTLVGAVKPGRSAKFGKSKVLARTKIEVPRRGSYTITLKAGKALKKELAKDGAKVRGEQLRLTATDPSGNRRRVSAKPRI